jgi:SAM-dependent methyltransferase
VTHTIVNSDQARAWNGYEGRHWAEHQDRWDIVNDGANQHLFAAASIAEHDRVLDIGCGNGLTSRLAARATVHGDVLGIDLSQPMLQRARASAAGEGITNLRYDQADAQVYPFAPASFDVAISRFGVMFFADPVAAFANIRRALRTSGRLAFVSLGALRDNQLGVLFAALASLTRPLAPGSSADSGPFSLSDATRIRAVLTAAGFSAASATSIELSMRFGNDAADAAQFLVSSGPLHAALEAADQHVSEQALQAATQALRPFETSDGVRLRGTHWLVRASC